MDSPKMTAEQLQALRNQMMSGQSQPTQQAAPSPQPAPQPMQQPMQQSAQRPSAQDAMRARMQASRGQSSTQPVMMEQGESYNPTPTQQVQQPTPVQAARTVNTEQPADQNVTANQTIINTTQSPDDGKSKGFKMNPVIAIVAVVAVLLVVFFGYSYLSKNSSNGEDTEPTEEYDPFDDPNIEWVEDPTGNGTGGASFYTFEQIEQLRAAGYTGTEIDNYAIQMMPYNDLIKQAEAARDAYIQSAIAPLYDTASDEYKHFVSQTWLTLPKREDFPEWNNIAMNYTKRENLDYEKIDVYGNQLFIKVYLDDNEHKDWFFCSVTPEEWNRLGDSGNIIVNYTYCTRYVGDDPWTAVEDLENICIISSSIEFVN